MLFFFSMETVEKVIRVFFIWFNFGKVTLRLLNFSENKSKC